LRRKRKINVVSVWIVVVFTVIAITLVAMFMLVYHSIVQNEIRTALREQAIVLRDNADTQLIDVLENQAARRLASKDIQTGYIDAMADGYTPTTAEIREITAVFNEVKATIPDCTKLELYFPSSGIVIGSQGVQYLMDRKYTVANSAVDYMRSLYPSDGVWMKRTVTETGSEHTYITYLRLYPGVYSAGTEPMLAISIEEADFLTLVRASMRTLDKELALLLVEPDHVVFSAEEAMASLVGKQFPYPDLVSDTAVLSDGQKVLVADALSGSGMWYYALVSMDAPKGNGHGLLVSIWAVLCVGMLLVGLVTVLRVTMKHYANPIRRIVNTFVSGNENEDKSKSPVEHLLQIESALSDMNKLKEERDYFTTYNKPLLRQSWLNCFIHGEAHYTGPQPQLEIEFPYPHFQVVITSETPDENEIGAIQQVFGDKAWVLEVFESREKETVLLFNHAFGEESLPEMLHKAGETLDAMESSLVFGVGILAPNDELVAASFRCARRAMSLQYFDKEQRVCVFDPAARHAEAESSLSQIITQLTELTSLIRREPQEDVEHAVDSIVSQLKETTPYLNTMRSIMLLAAMFLSKVVYDMKGAPEAVYGENLLNAYYHISDISEFSMRLKQDCSRLRSYLTQESSPGNRSVVQYAIHHIHNTNPAELSTHSIAEAIGISTGHLSRMFHQETGRKLVDYLQEVRMEHAAKLLADGQLSNEEICERIGYSRLQYFANKFKEHYGLTLNEYRNKCQTEQQNTDA